MARLYSYFGVVGIASIAAWGAALVLLAAFAWSRRRSRAYLAALVLSLLGFVLAKVNSHNISQIEVDRSAEEAALRARRPLAPTTADAARDTRPSTLLPPQPAYREAGKQRREKAAATSPGTASDTAASPFSFAGAGDEADVSTARRLPEADVIRADACDRLNLFFARLVPWLALVLVCLDYLSRFNRTTGYLWPIPIAGRAIDALFPKTHVVHVRTTRPGAAERLLEDVVRKGETFIYLGEADPWQAASLPRWSLGGRRLRPLEKVVHGVGGGPADNGFVFDCAWFGRYCFVVTGLEAAQAVVADLIAYLDARTTPRAAARRTVHVAWDFSAPLPAASLRRLTRLCREVNFKLLAFSAEPPAEEAATLFDERVAIPDDRSAEQ